MPLVSSEKTNWKFLAVVFILTAIVAGGILYYTKATNEELFLLAQVPQIQIPQKQPDVTANWETYIDNQNGFEFKYSQKFGADVWRPEFWPPTTTVISLNDDPVIKGCDSLYVDAGVSFSRKGKTRTNIEYSLYKGSGVGAGQLYSTYCYVLTGTKNYYVVIFVIHSHTGCVNGGCGAYCGTQYEQECRDQNMASDIEQPINKMISTFNFFTPSPK